MQKTHPLDLTSGLSCYTCNKTFTKRDLIENHFKTVRHQLECRKLMEEERLEQNCQNYRKSLMKMNNFQPRPYKARSWDFNRKGPLKIPLKSDTDLPDPRLTRRGEKRGTTTILLDIPQKKANKPDVEAQSENIQNLMNKSQAEKPKEKPKENSEYSVDFNSEKILEPGKEDQATNTAFFEEKTLAAKSTFEARSTLNCTDLLEIMKTSEDQVKSTANQEPQQIDMIQPKTGEETPKEDNLHQEDTEMPESSPGTRSTLEQLPHEDSSDTVEIFITSKEEDTLDQDLDKFIQEYFENNSFETRTVKLDNEWRITDSIGNPDFPELLKEDPNFDLLTFITEKMPF